MAAELSRFVACRRDHPARAGSADEHGLSAQPGVVELLDRREEGVHVDVEDGAVQHKGIYRTTQRRMR